VLQLGKKAKNFLVIIIGTIVLSGCARAIVDKNNDIGSGNLSTIPVGLNTLIEYAEYCETIYDSGGSQKDDVAFEVKQTSDKSIIIIRGTANEANILSDLDVALVSDARSGILLHRGFQTAAATVMQIIDNEHIIKSTVHITGHSLGGAISQIIGLWLHNRGHNVQIISFGSPKISSQILNTGQPTHWRVVRRSDPIPFTPPWPYIHTGTFINSKTGAWGPDNDNGLISETDGLDHAIAKYVTTLKELL
jgi:hypothetical protein